MAKRKLAEALIYESFNSTERRIIDQWVAGGMTLLAACERVCDDLEDAAEEDGYDGA